MLKFKNKADKNIKKYFEKNNLNYPER